MVTWELCFNDLFLQVPSSAGANYTNPRPRLSVRRRRRCSIHAVWFIRDTSIRDMVEFPKQAEGHMVIETIGSDTAKGQSSF